MKTPNPFSKEDIDSLNRYLNSNDAEWFRLVIKSLGGK